MAYSNFNQAWDAWVARYAGFLTWIVATQTYLGRLQTSTTLAAVRDNAYGAIHALLFCFYDHLGIDTATWPYTDSCHYMAVYYASKEPAGGEVTMAAILSAMLGAKFTELQDFIGIEDAYRVALWNAPFNANFYAALARGFIKWP